MEKGPIKDYIPIRQISRKGAKKWVAKYKKDSGLVKKSKIPPALKFVKINRNTRDKIRMTGIDNKGKLQYFYTEKAVKASNNKKYKKLKRTGLALAKLRLWCNKNIYNLKTQKIASVICLLDCCKMRPGDPRKTKKYGSRGATTLLPKNFNRKTKVLKWVGKAKVKHSCKITNSKLANVLPKTLGQVNVRTVNRFLQNNFKITCKDIRTFHANASYIHGILNNKSKKEAIKYAAKQLQNLPITCKNNYISPAILKITDKSQIKKKKLPKGSCLKHHEKVLISILK